MWTAPWDGPDTLVEIAGRLTTGRLICIDRDQAAIDAAQDRLAPWLDRVTLIHSNFSELEEVLSRCRCQRRRRDAL